ncbi:hypothetical protein F4804DRAFT_348406 [Jackrogersella minutella]|nr:hypothetical protein F4804DRAFT_348406 [Jackrogersella minutella]
MATTSGITDLYDDQGEEIATSQFESGHREAYALPPPRELMARLIPNCPPYPELPTDVPPHKVGGYDPLNPHRLCELENCALHRRREDTSISQDDTSSCQGYIGTPSTAEMMGMRLPDISDDDVTSERPMYPNHMMFSEHSTITEPEGFIKPPLWYVMSAEEADQPSNVSRNSDSVDSSWAESEGGTQALRSPDSGSAQQRSYASPSGLLSEIRYIPQLYDELSKPESRMVLITGLKPNMAISDVMARVRGGKILKVATFTSPKPVGHTVMVEFVRHDRARAYAEYMKDRAATVFASGVQVNLVNTNSYPIGTEMDKDLKWGFSRLLVWLDFSKYSPKDFLEVFQVEIGEPEEYLEDVWLDENLAFFILFKSITGASYFYKTTASHMKEVQVEWFDHNLYRFAPDPCDKPLKTLDPSPSHLYQRRQESYEAEVARTTHRSLLQSWLNWKESLIAMANRPSNQVWGLGDEMRIHPFFVQTLERLNRPDYQIAPTHWEYHRHRHQSFISHRRHRRDAEYLGSPSPNESFDMSERARRDQDSAQSTPSAASFGGHDDSQCLPFRPKKQNYKGKGKAKEESPQNTSSLLDEPVPYIHFDVSSPEAGPSTHVQPSSPSPLIDISDNTDEDDSLVPKYMLPQNDPAFFELLNRDRSDLVSRAEANAIFSQQEFRTISKDEMRARYRAFFPVRDQMAAWRRGEDYDPEATENEEIIVEKEKQGEKDDDQDSQ